MAYNVSQEYNEIIYSGDAQNRLKLLFNNVEYATANSKTESVKKTSKILADGGARFSLDNFKAQEVEIVMHDIDLEDIVEPVSISIGTLVNDEYEYVPLGIYNLSEAPTTSSGKTTIKLIDNAVKFDFPYNAQGIIEANGGKATMMQILQDICTQCNVTLGVQSFINQSTEVSVWDNSISARQYVMYIAEKAGCIATIDRDGELIFVDLNSQAPIQLNPLLFEKYTAGDELTISRVVYEDAIRKFEASYVITSDVQFQADKSYFVNRLDEYIRLQEEDDYQVGDLIEDFGEIVYEQDEETTGGTLYINSANPYILSQQEIDKIYDNIKGLSLYSMNISKILGNPALDPWDIVEFTYNDITYRTLAQNTLNYRGTMIQSFDTQMGSNEKSQENVTFNGEASKYRRLSTRIDQAEGNIELTAAQVESVQTDLQENHYSKEETELLVLNAETGITNTFSEAGGNNIFRNTGLWFEETTAENNLFPKSDTYPSADTFTRKLEHFEFWNGEVLRNHNTNAANETSMLLQKGTVFQEQTVPNGSYTVSFKYKKLIELAVVKCIINDVEYILDSLTDTEFQQTIEVSSQHINIQFVTDTNNSCEIYDLMVNAGTVKLAYSQNQNETTTDTVNISKGITITSSNTETTFRANSDGIRTEDKNGNILSEFTDRGMTNKTQIIEDEAIIVDVLIQRVGNHTWFTKI